VEIAEELHLSEGTVRNYLSEAISKLGASNRVEAARLARARGWL
jgi:two-component system response regulator DesR